MQSVWCTCHTLSEEVGFAVKRQVIWSRLLATMHDSDVSLNYYC